MLTFNLFESRVVGGWDKDKVRLEKTSLKNRFKRKGRKEEQGIQRRKKSLKRTRERWRIKRERRYSRGSPMR
jgi:hypothetical protein